MWPHLLYARVERWLCCRSFRLTNKKTLVAITLALGGAGAAGRRSLPSRKLEIQHIEGTVPKDEA